MPSDDNAAESVPLDELYDSNALFRAYVLARLMGLVPDTEQDEAEGVQLQPPEAPAVPPMPVPIVMPQPTLATGTLNIPSPDHTAAAPPMPQPTIDTQAAPTQPADSVSNPPVSNLGPAATSGPVSRLSSAAPSPSVSSEPLRPPSPDDGEVVRSSLLWRLHVAPLYTRLAQVLYESKDNLPERTTGNISYLRLDGFSARDTVENMCALVEYLHNARWADQLVDRFIDSMKSKPHWPAKLKDKPHHEHVYYVWHMMDGLLAVIGLKLYIEPAPPLTFAGAVDIVFPPVPKNAVKPKRFSFSARELIEEDFIIQPTPYMLDHLKLVGNAVTVYILYTEQISLLLGYDRNRVARAVGMSNYGEEIMQSYGALVNEEFRENYTLPISLGMFKIDPDRARRGQYDDLTVIAGVIEQKHKNPSPYHPPQLLASRVLIIENELRRRRRWYNRLRRDIQKRKKTEPWMFWGTVLAVFFGICTVIQTITSVWSLIVSLKQG
ncbi:hypothetical protein BV20DRAFT_1039225 [Pilatotrama ljubarskyi]|nr:hypothetical protein BV20DRAFT_1039225 [Pilatotrama ljubarskyi]